MNITPADVARMLKNAAQTPKYIDKQPFYSSFSASQPQSSAQPKPSAQQQPSVPPLSENHYEQPEKQAESSNQTDATSSAAAAAVKHAAAPTAKPEPTSAPTPAIMAKKREEKPAATFPSLDSREFPIVREYSAGGLIFDENDRVAIIARYSRAGNLEWCLPKGHIEKGETPEQAAVREISEETGIVGKITSSIATIDYWFTGASQRIHKMVHHYALQKIGGRLSVLGDPDGEAEDAAWVAFDDLANILSYPNERHAVWIYTKKYRNSGQEGGNEE